MKNIKEKLSAQIHKQLLVQVHDNATITICCLVSGQVLERVFRKVHEQVLFNIIDEMNEES